MTTDSDSKQCVVCGSEEHEGEGWIYHTTDTEVARIQADGTLERELKDDARPICSHECKDGFADRFLDNESTDT
jgi:hypothetical protein